MRPDTLLIFARGVLARSGGAGRRGRLCPSCAAAEVTERTGWCKPCTLEDRRERRRVLVAAA